MKHKASKNKPTLLHGIAAFVWYAVYVPAVYLALVAAVCGAAELGKALYLLLVR
jgi:hypothetical protein